MWSELHDKSITFYLLDHDKILKPRMITESICWLLKAFTGTVEARIVHRSYPNWPEKWAVIEVHDPLNLESINGNQFQLMAIHLKVPPDYGKMQLLVMALLLRVHRFVCHILNAHNAEWPHRRSLSSVRPFQLQNMCLYLTAAGFVDSVHRLDCDHLRKSQQLENTAFMKRRVFKLFRIPDEERGPETLWVWVLITIHNRQCPSNSPCERM
jgi:hypothetical protein